MTMLRAMRSTLALVLLAGCTRTTPEMQVIEDAARAMGGRSAIEAVKTLVIEGAGENFNLGQNKSPDAELPKFAVAGFKRAIDVANGRWRQEQTRTPQFVTGNPAPQKQIAGVDGEVAYNVAPDGTATRASDQVASDRRAELRHSPVGILRAALAPGAQVTNARQHENHDIVQIKTADGQAFTLAVDSTTKLPAQVVSMSYNTNLGDVAMETVFENYQDAGDLELPTVITSRLDKYTLATIRVSKNTVNGETGELTAPAAARSASSAPPAPNVTVEVLAPGVWYLAGQSHHSVLVEFSDHLTLIEAPQNDTRTLAVIAKARALRPDKPLTHVVNTHHHFDHSGGVRAAVSEGLTVIAHELSKPFFEDMIARKHTIVPDALSRNPKPLKIETVGSQLVLKNALRTVDLYPVTGNAHADTLLMAYFPKEQLLVEVDAYTPPAPNAPPPPAFPFAASLVDNVKSRNLKVDRVVPLHGRIVPFADLVAAAQTPAPAQSP